MKRKREPRPRSLSTFMVPPYASTRPRAIASPSPAPGALSFSERVLDCSPRNELEMVSEIRSCSEACSVVSCSSPASILASSKRSSTRWLRCSSSRLAEGIVAFGLRVRGDAVREGFYQGSRRGEQGA